MSIAREESREGAVVAMAEFGIKDGVTPVALVKSEGQGPDSHSGGRERHQITIHDARPMADTLELDRHGFTLLRRGTAVRDFYDDEEVVQVYYPEMEALIKEATGAAEVIVFDHTIRVEDEAKQADLALRAPVVGMHNDFTVASAAHRVRDLLPPAEAEARLKGRYGSINVWRPIASPVENKPLAICSWDSIEDDDLIAAERHYPDGRIGGIYYLAHNPDQRWHYFPGMTGDEVILLKCFDSLTDGTARWTAHGSFDDPTRPADARRRESIEIRTLYFFD